VRATAETPGEAPAGQRPREAEPAGEAWRPASPWGEPAGEAWRPASPWGEPAGEAWRPASPWGEPAGEAWRPASPWGEPPGEAPAGQRPREAEPAGAQVKICSRGPGPRASSARAEARLARRAQPG